MSASEVSHGHFPIHTMPIALLAGNMRKSFYAAAVPQKSFADGAGIQPATVFTQYALKDMTMRLGGSMRDERESYGDDNEAVIAAATEYIMRTERGQRRRLFEPEDQEDGPI